MKGNTFNLYTKRFLNYIVIIISLSLSTTTSADNFWTCSDGDWNDSTCWNDRATPFSWNYFLTQSDNINRTVTYTKPLNSGQVSNLTIDSTGSGTTTLSQTQGIFDTSTIYLGFNGVGTYTLQNGTHNTNYLYIGENNGSNGTFNLVSGNLNTFVQIIGRSGNGTVHQSGGTNSVTNNFTVGSSTGGSGAYTLSGTGNLKASSQRIGVTGTGLFTQNGGTNTSDGSLLLGYSGIGKYILNGGSLTVGEKHGQDETIGGINGTGQFIQNGGTHTVHGRQFLGGFSSNYKLNSGTLSSNKLNVSSLNGSFIQNGGTNTINTDFRIGTINTSSINSYTLSGGDLIVNGDINKISGGESVLNLNGGTLKVNNINVNTLNIASAAESDFTYTLELGKILTTNTINIANNVDSNGILIMQDGLLSADTINTDSAGAHFDFIGGSLSVDTFNGNLVNQGGTLAPGNSPLGHTTINGNYTQGNSGIFDVEIGNFFGGTKFDVMNVIGTAKLGGALNVSFYDFGFGDGLFEASLGDTFDILTADSLSGKFDILTLALLGEGLDWKLDYLIDFENTTDYVRLSVVSSVPVPAAIWLFGSGIVGLIGIARRNAHS